MIDFRALRVGDIVSVRGEVKSSLDDKLCIKISPWIVVLASDAYITKIEERPIGVGDKVIFKIYRDKVIRNLYTVKAIDKDEAWIQDIVSNNSHTTKLDYLERLTETSG